jgi:hypothetical protein
MLFPTSAPAVLCLGVATALQIPTPVPTQNFTQLLNHRSSDSTTFNQSYQLDTTSFRPGGPILFFQNDERAQPIGAGIGSINTNLFVDFAQELGTMRVCLEHRFFGTSFPEGFTGATPDQYDGLTLDNVIEDAVAVMKHIKTTVPGAEESKVIVTGSRLLYSSPVARIRTDKQA